MPSGWMVLLIVEREWYPQVLEINIVNFYEPLTPNPSTLVKYPFNKE